MFLKVVAPGECGNQVAFGCTPLFEYIKQLPDGYYIIGNAAYSVVENMFTPFTRGHENDPAKDAYNIFLSQLQICIEMSFGLPTNKRRILQAPLQTSLQLPPSEILMSCGRLHNFCINKDDTNTKETPTRFLLVLLEPNPRLQFGWGVTLTVKKYKSMPDSSIICDSMLYGKYHSKA
jgi:hypothetical protein